MAENVETAILLISIHLFIILIGFIMYNYIWIKRYGGVIPNPQYGSETDITFFNSKNFDIFIDEIYKRLRDFNYNYLQRSTGIESLVYLIFQREISRLFLLMSVISIFLYSIGFIIRSPYIEDTFIETFVNYMKENHSFLSSYDSFSHIISLIFFTFLHFRCFSIIKRESKYIYFERFDKMSRYKNNEWIACRTLHISGLRPLERNASQLKKKLDKLLEKEESGKVLDITIIPNYTKMLELEIQKEEIVDMKTLLTKSENWFYKLFLPKIYKSEESIQNALDEIEAKLNEEIMKPVLSSGHAFVAFDSLFSANKFIQHYEENGLQKVCSRIKGIFTSMNDTRILSARPAESTFQKFNDEDIEADMIDITNDELHAVVDPIIEPYDMIWTNIEGVRGLYILRRVLIFFISILILVFLTTPTSFFLTLKSINIISDIISFKWMEILPYGNIIRQYFPPIIILGINAVLILLIEVSSFYEKHYTHTRFQYSIFSKAFFYMLLNMLIIPGVSLTSAESLFQIMTEESWDVTEVLSKFHLTDSGVFFIILVCQVGSFSSVMYLLRLDELSMNSFSPFITFYRRHFINNGKQWHRRETDIFQFGYFYAQMLTIFSIGLVFSSTIPLICLVCWFFFSLRHVVDFVILLTVHRNEMDSSGEQINNVLKFTNIPIILYQLSMISYFIVKKNKNELIISIVILCLSIIYILFFSSKYLLDIYALHSRVKEYELDEQRIPLEEFNKWRNQFKHPLVLPVFIDRNHSNNERGSHDL